MSVLFAVAIAAALVGRRAPLYWRTRGAWLPILREGEGLVRGRRRAWIGFLGIVAVAQTGWYLALVGVIDATQHYSFWHEVPPTLGAKFFQWAAITVYVVVALTATTAVYGAMAAYSLQVAAGERPSRRRAAGRAASALARTWWWSVPLFGLSILGTVFVVWGPAVGQWAGLPAQAMTHERVPHRPFPWTAPEPWRFAHSVLGLATSCVTLAALLGATTVVGSLDGPIELAALPLVVAGYLAVGLLAAVQATVAVSDLTLSS